MCASHINRKISYSTFDFWINFRKTIKENINYLTDHNILDKITNQYIELFGIVIEKSKLDSLKIKKKHSSILSKNFKVNYQDKNLNDDDDLDLNEDKYDMTTYDYRKYADEIYLTIY